jgi:hypothetical protein
MLSRPRDSPDADLAYWPGKHAILASASCPWRYHFQLLTIDTSPFFRMFEAMEGNSRRTESIR